MKKFLITVSIMCLIGPLKASETDDFNSQGNSHITYPAPDSDLITMLQAQVAALTLQLAKKEEDRQAQVEALQAQLTHKNEEDERSAKFQKLKNIVGENAAYIKKIREERARERQSEFKSCILPMHELCALQQDFDEATKDYTQAFFAREDDFFLYMTRFLKNIERADLSTILKDPPEKLDLIAFTKTLQPVKAWYDSNIEVFPREQRTPEIEIALLVMDTIFPKRLSLHNRVMSPYRANYNGTGRKVLAQEIARLFYIHTLFCVTKYLYG